MDRPFRFLTAPFPTVLLWFTSVDLVFILVHGVGFLLHRAGLTGDVPHLLRISDDWALPESFNYLKWLIIILALTRVALRDRWWTPCAWALVFLLILADDSLQVHETFGRLIAESANLQAGFMVEASDLGELVVFGLMGLSVLLLTGASFTSAGARSRGLSIFYGLIIVGLGFFGVGIDFIHQAVVYDGTAHPALDFWKHVFAMIEDGGEMLVASLAAAFTLAPLPLLQQRRSALA
ncbi:MAG TPA: hypothetical protein VI412_10185 [Tabrizicola sp.]